MNASTPRVARYGDVAVSGRACALASSVASAARCRRSSWRVEMLSRRVR